VLILLNKIRENESMKATIVFEAEGLTVFYFKTTGVFWVVSEFGERVYPQTPYGTVCVPYAL